MPRRQENLLAIRPIGAYYPLPIALLRIRLCTVGGAHEMAMGVFKSKSSAVDHRYAGFRVLLPNRNVFGLFLTP